MIVVPGCGFMGPRATDSLNRNVPLTTANSISINGFNGSIVVRPGMEGQVEVLAKRTAQGATAEEAEANLDLLEVETVEQDSEVIVRANKPKGFKGGIAYEVTIPPSMQVAATTSNGSIKIESIGSVTAKSSNGSITVNGASGSVQATTSNGSINVDLDNPAEIGLTTSNGSVTFRGLLVPGNHKITTSNGSVNATLRDLPVEVDASTSNGKVRLAGNPGKRSAKAIVGPADSADSKLQIRTSNASVTVNYEQTTTDETVPEETVPADSLGA